MWPDCCSERLRRQPCRGPYGWGVCSAMVWRREDALTAAGGYDCYSEGPRCYLVGELHRIAGFRGPVTSTSATQPSSAFIGGRLNL